MAGNVRRNGLRKYLPGGLAQKVSTKCSDELEIRLLLARLDASVRCTFRNRYMPTVYQLGKPVAKNSIPASV